ncbi:MAG: hypothetical protein ACTTH7_08310 [Treponema sp.]
MLPIIVSGIYLTVIAMLIAFIIKNGIKLKNADAPQETRQYFYTALVMLVFLLISFAALLLRSNSSTVLSDSGADSTIGILAVKKSYTLLLWIAGLILIAVLVGLFDWFILRRTAKTPHQYRIRRLAIFGIGIFFIAVYTVLTLL